jgi:hypothetical protein
MHDRKALIAVHAKRAEELEAEAIAATADMDTERGEELLARAASARKAIRLLEAGLPLDACPRG